MKRIDRARDWTRNHLQLFRCPVCGASCTEVSGNSLVCVNRHTTDFNKHGYLYCLKGPSNDEYDEPLLAARRRLTQAGMFRPIVEQIAHLLPPSPQTILDVGTGEGTPLLQLAQERDNVHSASAGSDIQEHNDAHDTLVGFDISRAGVALAAQLPLDALFCVANLRDLPFADHSFTAVTELFSPSDYREFDRILAHQGTLIKVVPGSDHLKELRELFFPKGDARRGYDNSSVRSLFNEHYPHMSEIPIRYEFAVPSELRDDLVRMTPLQWGKLARNPDKEELSAVNSATIDALVLVGSQGMR